MLQQPHQQKKSSKALALALRLLSLREYCTNDLRTKLKEKGIEQEEINSTIDFLVEKEFISDQRFIKEYVQSKARKLWGPIRIMLGLKEKRISEENAQKAMEEIDFAEVITKAIEKNKKKFEGDKLTGKLLRLGFPHSMIYKHIKREENNGSN
jgi:regulatory protein